MWDTIREVLLSPNAIWLLIFLVVVIALLAYMTKKDVIHINTKGVRVGSADHERHIIRQQVEWIRVHCEGYEASMHKPDYYEKWLGKYISEKVYDEYVDWITFNHLTTSTAYVSIKQEKIINLIHSFIRHEDKYDYYFSDDFKNEIYKDVEMCIETLVQIREVYK